MSSWLEVGRPAVLEAITAACDEVDERARAELEDRNRKNQQLLDELNALKSRVVDVERLQQQNEFLQAELGRFQNMQNAHLSSPEKRTVLSDLSPNKSTAQIHTGVDPRTRSKTRDPDITTVVAKLKSTHVKYKAALSNVDKLRTMIRTRNHAYDEWVKHATALQKTIQKQHEIIQKLRAKLKTSSTVGTSGVDAISMDEDTVEVEYPNRPRSLPGDDQEIPSSPPVAATSRSRLTRLFPKRPVSELPPHVSSDDSFEGISNEAMQETENFEEPALPNLPDEIPETPPVIIKVEASSDGPELVWEKPAPKRNHRGDNREGTMVKRIKSEHSSSSAPEIVYESLSYSPAESIDYDQEVHVPTPRKRRVLPQDNRDDPVTPLGNLSRPGPLLTGQFMSGASSTRTTTPDKSRTPLPSAVSSKLREPSARLNMQHPDASHVGLVVKVDNSVSSSLSGSSLATKPLDVAGDGSVELDPRPTEMKGRLDILLTSVPKTLSTLTGQGDGSMIQTPRPQEDGNEKSRFSAAPKYSFSGKKARQKAATPPLKHNIGTTLSPNSSVGRGRAPKKPSILRDDMPRGHPDTRMERSLRKRPLEELRPEDFKPNPKYNDDISYVYDEVVRGREARAAISGCIDPNCCGKTFRHFAEKELRRVGHSVTTRSEEVILMEKYLHHDAFMLTTMEPEERQETWLKAKTLDLANKFGKHRQRYSRMSTPPGFWNVDFPDTQERAEERRQADEIRKALVAERHREAMRCDGSWLFRDEEPR